MRLFLIILLALLTTACGEDPPIFFAPAPDTAPTDTDGDSNASDVSDDMRGDVAVDVSSDLGEDADVGRDADATEDALPDSVGDVGEDATVDTEPDVGPDAEPDLIEDAGRDAVEDIEPDVIPDVAPDVFPDIEPDVAPDLIPDVAPDVIPDVAPDVIPDVEPDLIPDVEPDLIPDVEPDLDPGCTSVATLRAAPLGVVDARLCDVVVTYVSPFGFFVQEQRRTGPAINVFEDAGGWSNPDGLAPGDVVSFDVFETGEFRGMEQVVLRGAVAVERGAFDVESLVQDLSASGTRASEAVESELVRVVDAEVTSVSGRDVGLRYSGIDAELRVDDSGAFCVGMTLGVTGVVTENSPELTHRIQAWFLDDFELGEGDCVSDFPMAGLDDLLINEVLADPPTLGDANCDGERHSSEDEFIEVVNVSDRAVSLLGITVEDAVMVRHTFGAASELLAGQAVVVFGGGDPSCSFGGAAIERASSGSLGFSNDGDSITLAGPDGIIDTMTYAPAAANDTSVVLDPELNTAGAYSSHDEIAPDGSAFSPGTRIDGSSFP